MLWLKQSTPVTVKIGPFVDEDDGKTAETGLTIAQADVRLSKNGGNIAQKTESTSCTHDELGIYGCPIDATDTETAGRLQLWVHVSGALPVWHEFMVVPANVWDSFFGADLLQVHAAQITAGLITAATLASNTITANTIAADAIGASELAGDAVSEIADAVWDEVLTSAAHNVGYSAGQRLRYLILSGATAQAGTANTITLAATESATNDIHTQNIISIVSGTGAGQTRLILEYIGSTKIATVDRPWTTTPDSTSVYELLPFSGILLATHGVAQAATATTITLATTALAVANSYVGCAIYIAAKTGVGQTRLITAYTAGRVATVSPAWDTQPNNTSAYKVLPVGRSIIDTLSADAQAAIVDAVWDETSTGHVDAGKAGQQLWTDLDAILADTNEVQAELADGGRTDLLVDAIKAKTDNLPADPADDSDIDAQLAAIKVDTAAILADTGTSGVTLADDAITAAKIAANAIGASELATDAIGAAELATDAIAAIAAAVHLAGAGAITFTYTLTSTEDSSAITDADVWVTSDEAGSNVIASGETDENGKVVFYLDAGTYYVWRQKAGWNFTNPDIETVA